MQWINKRNRKYRKKAHHLLNKFLNEGWNSSVGKYVNCDFNSLKSFNANHGIRALLYSEQNGYCCYCMRKLNLGDRRMCTIEHVMPHKVNDSDLAFYFANVPHLRKNVRALVIDNSTRRLRHAHPYPHFCAYENLVLSCSGGIYETDTPEKECLYKIHACCNNARGKKRIFPIFFYKDVNMIYERDGLITCSQKYEHTIDVLQLETENLCLFRKAWAYLLSSHSMEKIKDAMAERSLREEILMDTPLKLNEVKRLCHPLYWETLYEYRWFGLYFQRHMRQKKQ